ncbi:hypothetical protein [Saccharothrix xinjiangensis]|uniref:Uncharacterized protein n=1 Tax=Saccharothrix xinjiangensis TaxID=204798 RepID=A0ABV9Y100_9PSEU
MHSTSSRRRGALLALLVATLAAAFLTGPSGAQAAPVTPDVFMRDNPGDTGAEPGAGDIWQSPDIVICATPSKCLADVVITPGQTYYIFVTAYKNGQGDVPGVLRLYHTKAGGNVSWPSGWQEIGAHGTTITASTHTFMFQWTVPSDWRHYCLLARWESTADPMTFAEGPSTEDNTRSNNNIVWHNVVTAGTTANGNVLADFMVGNPFGGAAQVGLAVTPAGEPFVGPGRVVVDLGATLFERWRAGGGQAVGVRQVGTTQFQVVDPKLARFSGLQLRGGERLPVQLVFTGAAEASGKPVNVFQTDAQGVDRGGVQYRLTFR